MLGHCGFDWKLLGREHLYGVALCPIGETVAIALITIGVLVWGTGVLVDLQIVHVVARTMLADIVCVAAGDVDRAERVVAGIFPELMRPVDSVSVDDSLAHHAPKGVLRKAFYCVCSSAFNPNREGKRAAAHNARQS
eukprot:SAG31_NODE_7308_length_1724_cov_1.330462_1_plen_137_part_00